MRLRSLLVVAVVLGSFELAARADSLRQCPNDGRYAYSDEWLFCPWCGTRLPLVPERTVVDLPETYRVLGNIYSNRIHAFSIERPGEAWQFITEKEELKELNPDATVALEYEGSIYSMVIVENLPGVPLAKYATLVSPSLDNLVLLADDPGKVSGLDARKRVWQGKHNDLPFRFHYTLLARGDVRFQIVSWCSDSQVTPEILAQIAFIENSFKSLGEGPLTALQAGVPGAGSATIQIHPPVPKQFPGVPEPGVGPGEGKIAPAAGPSTGPKSGESRETTPGEPVPAEPKPLPKSGAK